MTKSYTITKAVEATSFRDVISVDEVPGVSGTNAILLLAEIESSLASMNLSLSSSRPARVIGNFVQVDTAPKDVDGVLYIHRIIVQIKQKASRPSEEGGDDLLVTVYSEPVDGKEKAPKEVPSLIFDQLKEALRQ